MRRDGSAALVERPGDGPKRRRRSDRGRDGQSRHFCCTVAVPCFKRQTGRVDEFERRRSRDNIGRRLRVLLERRSGLATVMRIVVRRVVVVVFIVALSCDGLIIGMLGRVLRRRRRRPHPR